jgi:RNA polymerase sigma factor (TIGR02999 family)
MHAAASTFREAMAIFTPGPALKLGFAASLEYLLAIPMSDVTLILQAVGRGEREASEELLPLVYEELRRLAAARMARESAGHTLQPTALVHEAWLRLVNDKDRSWQNRGHFFAAAAEAMRRILIDNARRKARLKHGGGQQRLNIDDVEPAAATPDEKLLLLNGALEELERENPEYARIVMLKYFTGLTNFEAAETLGISESTVERHWFDAKRLLFKKIRASA